MQLLRSKQPGKMAVRLIIALFILGVIIALRYSGIQNYINVAQLKEQQRYLQAMVEQHYLRSVLLYIVSYATVVAFSLPVAAIFTIAGGFLFGIFFGAIYANIGATLGAIIAFLLVRYLIGGAVQQKYQIQLARFNEQFKEHGTSFLLSIHFIAVIPFFLINALAGLTKVSLWTFVWTTSAGIFPGALVYAFAGQQLNTIQTVKDVFSLNIIIAFALLALLATVPVLFKKFVRWRGRK